MSKFASFAETGARSIVTCDVAGCRAVVTDGVEGLLVPPRDAPAAAAALVRLARDPALRLRMGENARRRFEAEFSDEVVNRKVEALYRACLDHRVR